MKAVVYLIGEAESFLAATRKTVTASNTLKREFGELSLSASKSAEAQVKASLLRTSRIREEMTAIRELAATYKRGSSEQIAAMNLVARKQEQLNRLTGESTALQLRHGRASARQDERRASGLIRGGLRGGGLGGGIGLAALAGSAFFGSFLATGAVKASIDAATESAAVERQLAAQYKASGQALGDYRKQIDDTLARESALSGFNKDELTQSYISIFRAAGSTSAALKDEAIAADVARGRHMDLQAASLLVAKVLNGNVGLLKRYGIETYKGETATEALAAVSAKYAGQAQAGTTAQQRFSAELHNSEVIIGTALLPTVTRLLGEGAKWLDQMNRSGRLQRDVNQAVHDGAIAAGLLKDGINLVRGAFHLADGVTGSFKNTLKDLLEVWAGFKFVSWASGLGSFALAERAAGSAAATSAAEMAAMNRRIFTTGSAAAVSTVKVSTLRSRLLGLGAISLAPIVIPIAIKIEKNEADFIKQHLGKTASSIFGFGEYIATGGAAGKNPVQSIVDAVTGSGNKSGRMPSPHSGTGFRSADLRPPGSNNLPPLHTFALPQNIQDALAGALTPRQDKTAAQDALAYTQKLLNSGRLVGQAYTDALKERKKLYAEISRDSKKIAGPSSSLLPRLEQEALAKAQGDAASKSLPALRALEVEQQKALGVLRSQHDVGANRVKQLKEEAQLQRQIAATAKQIASAEKNALKEHDAALAHKILGMGSHPVMSAIQAVQAQERKTLNQALADAIYGVGSTSRGKGQPAFTGAEKLAVITGKTAKLSTAGLVELVRRDLGDKLPKATLESLNKINKVLELKFLPPDVLANIRGRLAQIKSTLTAGLAGINQTANGYRGVSADEFVKGIPGLTRAQRVALEERYSQVEAHGGAPRGPAILGMPTQGGSVIHIANLHVTGVENLDHLITQIEKRTRHKVQRGGVRR